MTARLSYPYMWAQNGTATDPDTDTTHPSYIANRYASTGWKSEKPPEAWQNFLSQISDAKIIQWLSYGFAVWDSSVAYAPGSIVRKSETDSTLYLNISTSAATNIALTNTSVWSTIMDGVASSYLQKVSDLQTKYNNHLNGGNVHNDNIKNIIGGGYYKNEVDDFFGSPTDPKTIVYHVAQKGSGVHGETPAQVGTLPTSGGTFTGPVIFNGDVVVSVSPSKLLRRNTSTGYLELLSGSLSFGLDAAGTVWYTTGGGSVRLVTEDNFQEIDRSLGFTFALPVPLLSMNLESDINDQTSIGTWTINTSANPVFEVGKGLKIASMTATLTGVTISPISTLVVIGWNDATPASFVKVTDLAASRNYTTLASIITAAGASAMTHIKQIIFYPRLSVYQKSMLVK